MYLNTFHVFNLNFFLTIYGPVFPLGEPLCHGLPIWSGVVAAVLALTGTAVFQHCSFMAVEQTLVVPLWVTVVAMFLWLGWILV